ncbi:MAG: 2-amino-4-hydroxy-6-hydroxymethyldihydropteridine diphosphokinase, partial [bacterium]
MVHENVFLGLGSNVGDRCDYLRTALTRIAELATTRILATSSIYESSPVGFRDQDDFLNMVARVSTTFSPEDFLKKLQKIEKALGRHRKIRWGPRTIDIDILFWGNETVNSERLKIPHPEAINRRFVLLPMNEIAANFVIPSVPLTIGEALRKIGGDDSV